MARFDPETEKLQAERSATGIAAIRKRRLAQSIRAFPVQMPLPDMIAELNQFRPVLLAGYASVMVLLADEQEAGRLQIQPVLVLPTSEGLSEDGYDRNLSFG